MANWNNDFPSWGDTGEQPPSNKNYGAEQVNEKHFDYLWDQLNKTFDDILDHTIQDDGSVSMDADLNMGGNNIDNLDELRDDGTAAKINFPGDGRVLIDVDDGSGGITPSLTLSAGPQADVTVDSGDFFVTEGGISILGANLNMGGNDIEGLNSQIAHNGSNAFFKFNGSGGAEFKVDNGLGGFTSALTIGPGTDPDITIDNGNLIMNNGSIIADVEVVFNGGARIFRDANGELIAQDDDGNSTQLT